MNEVYEILIIGIVICIVFLLLYLLIDKLFNRCKKCGTKLEYDDIKMYGDDLVCTKRCPKCEPK